MISEDSDARIEVETSISNELNIRQKFSTEYAKTLFLINRYLADKNKSYADHRKSFDDIKETRNNCQLVHNYQSIKFRDIVNITDFLLAIVEKGKPGYLI